METNILGENLKKLRKNNEYKQSYIARELGISEAAISKYENGKQDPSYDILLKLADLYNESLDFIFSRDRFIEMVNNEEKVIRVSEELYKFVDLLRKDEYQKLLKFIEKDPKQGIRLIVTKLKQDL